MSHTINIPVECPLPKYSLFENTPLGMITGLIYHRAGTQIAAELGEGWIYEISPSDESVVDDLRFLPEEDLEDEFD